MSDLIERQVAENAICNACGKIDCDQMDTCEKVKLPSAQPQRTGRWIDYVKDGYVECPFCHSATNCDDNISELHFCFSCGARMEG